jgi:hypothetical protein
MGKVTFWVIVQRNEKGWRYAHIDNNGKPIRTPYTLQLGEMSYDQWIKQQKN